MPYAQFIHGKIRGGRSYQLVAFSADLAGRQAELETLARQYRFWGAHPPTENPVAVGLFRHEGGFLLAQAMRAALPDGRPAADAQGRAFTQHRYVFVPAPALKALSGRLWLLLNWFVSAAPTIPVLSAIDPALPPLPEPNPAPAWSDRAAVGKLTRVINLRPPQGRPVLLDALAALTNGKRVVLDAAAGPGVASEDVLESLLMLLPAACRMQVSMAAGALDERVCTRADVLLKTNGPPEGQLPADLLWLRRAGNRFFGASSPETFSGPYPALLEPIVARPESLPILLRILDDQTAAPENGRAPAGRWHALRNGSMTARLMPAMPDPAVRARYWRDALAGLSPDGWRAIIPNILDETGLEIAWLNLKKSVKTRPAVFAPLVFLLWQNVSAEYVTYALSAELPADPDLAETLLRHGLLAEISLAQYPAARKMAAAVVANRAADQPARAAELVSLLADSPCFAEQTDRLALLDAVLPAQANRRQLADFVTLWLLPILPDVPAAALSESRWGAALAAQWPKVAAPLKAMLAGRAVDRLPELAAALGLSLPRRKSLAAACLNAWRPSYRQAAPLLTDLVTQWIAAFSPDDRPPLPWLFEEMTGWLSANAPENLRPLLTVSGAPFAFADWQTVAGALYPPGLPQTVFLDHVSGGRPVAEMVARWLATLADQPGPDTRARFEAGYTAHALRSDGPAWLVEAVDALTGGESVSLVALLPLIDRLQTDLAIPQTVLVRLIEALPRPAGAGDGLGAMLTPYLPRPSANGDAPAAPPDDLPLWQLLNAQAPKVAQVFKTLAEGGKNPALDMLNQRKLSAALAESPQYAPALALWLHHVGRGNWLSGRLLETLAGQWLAGDVAIDPHLLAGLLRPELTAKYAAADWLALAPICWRPEFLPLWPSAGQPVLNSRQRGQAVDSAKLCLARATEPAYAQKLLAACRNWGLRRGELAELVAEIPSQLCNFGLLHTYLYSDGAVIEPQDAVSNKLIALALQLSPTDPIEQAQLKTFVRRLLKRALPEPEQAGQLIAWGQSAVNRQIWRGALTGAVTELAAQHFSALLWQATRLQSLGEKSLSRMIVQSLDEFWGKQKAQFD